MFNITTAFQTLDNLYALLFGFGIIAFIFFIIFVFALFAIIHMEKHFKDLVDLQYKIYKESKGESNVDSFGES